MTSTLYSISRRLAALTIPPNVPQGQVWRYGLGFPMQISPTHAAVIANIHRKLAPTEDYEVGADAIVFDDLSRLVSDQAVPLTRIERATNPKTGEPVDLLKAPPIGGFVPLGARRDDGSPHPHAGTGFGVGMALAYHVDDGDRSKPYRGCIRGSQSYMHRELFQFAFDGETFRVTDVQAIAVPDLLPGQVLLDAALRSAIPDGDDLLSGGTVGQPEHLMDGSERLGTGVVRWRCSGGRWRPIAFHPVCVEHSSGESSLIRDLDGSLLFSCRPGYDVPDKRNVVVWRSRDGGESWQVTLRVTNLRYPSPMTLNQAADGTPYIVCNPWMAAPMAYDGQRFADGGCRTTSREMLMLWPLDDKRTGLLSPHVASFPRYEFGPAPVWEGELPAADHIDPGQTNKGRDWSVDHPNGMTLRLRDGQWHHLLCHRLLAQAEVQGPILPTPHSGLRFEEVLSHGPAHGDWRF